MPRTYAIFSILQNFVKGGEENITCDDGERGIIDFLEELGLIFMDKKVNYPWSWYINL